LIRMPPELYEVLRILSFESRESINQIMIETLVNNVAEIRRDPTDQDSPYLSEEPEIGELLEKAEKQIRKQFFKEHG